MALFKIDFLKFFPVIFGNELEITTSDVLNIKIHLFFPHAEVRVTSKL